MKRYPHTATIEQVTEIDNGSGIPTITETQFSIKGRYEPKGQGSNLDQSAKFYCRKDARFDNGNITGQKLFFNGSWIGITNAFNYQTHCELWLD